MGLGYRVNRLSRFFFVYFVKSIFGIRFISFIGFGSVFVLIRVILGDLFFFEDVVRLKV